MQQPYFQLRIVLLGVLPLIWRRVRVARGGSFWDLHAAIQGSMGWEDKHLHLFRIVNPKTRREETIGTPEANAELSERTVQLQDYLHPHACPVALYEYDFGDGWIHEVVLEEYGRTTEVLPEYLEGEGACPPEDVGGPPGYQEYLKRRK